MLPNRSTTVQPLDSDKNAVNEWYKEKKIEYNLDQNNIVNEPLRQNPSELFDIEKSEQIRMNKVEQPDPRKNVMTPDRYFELKKKSEAPIIEETNEVSEEKKRVRKHVRKALPRYIQKENLVSASSKGYHIFYDEVMKRFFNFYCCNLSQERPGGHPGIK
jgi:hypothetical protein